MHTDFFSIIHKGPTTAGNKMVWAIDRELNFLYTSPSFTETYRRLVGRTPQCGSSILDPAHRQHFWGAQENYARSLQGEDISYEHEFSMNNEKVHLEICHCPIGVGQEVAGVLAIANNITDRKRAEAALINSLSVKDICLREAYHRIKNNFQTLESLLRLQAAHSDSKDGGELLNDALNRVKTMSLIHRVLSDSEDLSTVNFGNFLRMLSTMLLKSYRADGLVVGMSLDIEDALLPTDMAIPCGMIANELISNALKHAFAARQKGEINIILQTSGDMNTLIVRDDGAGLPTDMDIRKTESLGMNIVYSLLKQIYAEMSIKSGSGTEFMVTFGNDIPG